MERKQINDKKFTAENTYLRKEIQSSFKKFLLSFFRKQEAIILHLIFLLVFYKLVPIKKILQGENVPVKIWTEDIEIEAEQQLLQLATLPFIFKHIAVMPDVHAGKGSTIGTVYASKDTVIPAAVGVDIGCGMAAVQTPFRAVHLEGKLAQLRKEIERSIPVGFDEHRKPTQQSLSWKLWEQFFNLHEGVHKLFSKAQKQLGTLGGGNHFIEICLDPKENVWILLHSGSRNIGKTLADVHIEVAQQLMKRWNINVPHKDLSYLPIDTSECKQYLSDVLWAQSYALENRNIMLQLVIKDVRNVLSNGEQFDSIQMVNCHHNYVSLEHHFGHEVWVTRKGAIRAQENDNGIIPGSMGAKSYIVKGLGNSQSFCSASHGAGRKMSRNKARALFTEKDLYEQTKGVECRKDKRVIDEIPEAYKNIDEVMQNQNDLVEIVMQLKQVICVKG